MSASAVANMSFWVRPVEHEETTYTLHLTRLVFIDTAEESDQWLSRARRQWGSNHPIAVRVTNEKEELGITTPKTMGSNAGWTGISWCDEDDDKAAAPGIEIPSDHGSILVLEVVSTGEHSRTVCGVGMLNYATMISEKRQYGKYCVHLFPTQTTIDAGAVYALLEAEIRSSAWDAHPEDTFAPLEYNFGSVRVSTLDFYFPSFTLTGGGEYVVSNVLCAMNMTESSALAMQLVPLHTARDFITVEPAHVITVKPQQRVYFSATWNPVERACMRKLEVQLLVNGSQPPSAPVILLVHNSTPQLRSTDTPYHYWLNTTCATNRQFSFSQEFPLIRALLPVYRFVSNDGAPGVRGEGVIVALDKDSGESVLVRADGVPIVSAMNSGVTLAFSNQSFASLALAQVCQAECVAPGNDCGPTAYSGPPLNLLQKTCQCSINLGTIRGLPMVYEVLTGVSPSFQVSVTLLDQRGWQVVKGETKPVYQSASGSLHWDDQLVLRKWPGASANQFVRLNLTEVRSRDGDETPIGAALVSLCRLDRTAPQVGVQLAFHVYETYSLYDTLYTSSLLMKNAFIVFSELPS